MPITVDVANLREFDKAIADYAKATGRSLEYSALRAARNWVIQASRKFRKFGQDAKPIDLMAGDGYASSIVSYRLHRLADRGLLPTYVDDAGKAAISYGEGRKTRVERLARRGQIFTRAYARQYARRATRYPYSRRGFIRVLPWRISMALDQKLLALGEAGRAKYAKAPPARKRHAGEIAMHYDAKAKRLSLSIVAVYDYKTSVTLAGQDIAPGVRKMNSDMETCMTATLPAVIRDMRGYIARKLRERK